MSGSNQSRIFPWWWWKKLDNRYSVNPADLMRRWYPGIRLTSTLKLVEAFVWGCWNGGSRDRPTLYRLAKQQGIIGQKSRQVGASAIGKTKVEGVSWDWKRQKWVIRLHGKFYRCSARAIQNLIRFVFPAQPSRRRYPADLHGHMVRLTKEQLGDKLVWGYANLDTVRPGYLEVKPTTWPVPGTGWDPGKPEEPYGNTEATDPVLSPAKHLPIVYTDPESLRDFRGNLPKQVECSLGPTVNSIPVGERRPTPSGYCHLDDHNVWQQDPRFPSPVPTTYFYKSLCDGLAPCREKVEATPLMNVRYRTWYRLWWADWKSLCASVWAQDSEISGSGWEKPWTDEDPLDSRLVAESQRTIEPCALRPALYTSDEIEAYFYRSGRMFPESGRYFGLNRLTRQGNPARYKFGVVGHCRVCEPSLTSDYLSHHDSHWHGAYLTKLLERDVNRWVWEYRHWWPHIYGLHVPMNIILKTDPKALPESLRVGTIGNADERLQPYQFRMFGIQFASHIFERATRFTDLESERENESRLPQDDLPANQGLDQANLDIEKSDEDTEPEVENAGDYLGVETESIEPADAPGEEPDKDFHLPTPEDAKVIILYFEKHWTQRQIAELLNQSTRWVRYKVAIAKAQFGKRKNRAVKVQPHHRLITPSTERFRPIAEEPHPSIPHVYDAGPGATGDPCHR